jgi:N-methylhydantoinase A/oxoprolinase/acetone carboxylase beta subunit
VDSVVAVLSVGSGAAAGVVAEREIGEFAAILFDVG